MKVTCDIDELHCFIREKRIDGIKNNKDICVSLIPTMGALHDGHLYLIKQAKQQSENNLIIVSIFVNPLQFGPNEDFDRYPRPLKEDLEKLKELADCVFTPEIKNIIGNDEELVKINAGPISKVLEGKTRPNYFDGVLTIVAKLFNIVQPDVALFGKKDAQQEMSDQQNYGKHPKDPNKPMIERMLSGELYNYRDDVIEKELNLTAKWLARLNASSCASQAERQKIIRERIGTMGEGCDIRPPFYCDYGTNIKMGSNVILNFNCCILDVVTVTIGDGTLFGPNVQIYAADHPRDRETRLEGWEFGRPITIGKNVWIGGGAIILPGVTIGDDAIIGAGSVVTKNVLPGTTVAGNPARPIVKK